MGNKRDIRIKQLQQMRPQTPLILHKRHYHGDGNTAQCEEEYIHSDKNNQHGMSSETTMQPLATSTPIRQPSRWAGPVHWTDVKPRRAKIAKDNPNKSGLINLLLIYIIYCFAWVPSTERVVRWPTWYAEDDPDAVMTSWPGKQHILKNRAYSAHKLCL